MDSQTPQTSSPNECYGNLIVQVTTAQGAIPLEGARVYIRAYNPENANESARSTKRRSPPAAGA